MTTIIITVLIFVVGLLTITVLAGIVMYNAAKQKKQASFVKESTIEFVMAGEKCIRVLENVKGYYYHPGEITYNIQVGKKADSDIIDLATGRVLTPAGSWYLVDKPVRISNAIVMPEPGHIDHWSPGKYLRRRWGFFWVGWLYPQTHIHKFEIQKTRVRRGWTAGAPLDKMVETDPAPVEVEHLRWRITRAITVIDIECLDKVQVSLGVQFIMQVLVPEIVVFVNKGSFFQEVESLVSAAIISYCSGVGIDEFLSNTKIGQDSDFLARVISHVNEAMITRYGVVVIEAWIVDIVNKAQDALQASKIAKLEGEARNETARQNAAAKITTANGDAQAIKIVADAEAEAIRLQGKAEAEVLMAQFKGTSEATVIEALRRKGLAEFKGQALSQGGGGQIVQLASAAPKPADKPSSGGAESDLKAGKTGVKNTP